MAQLLAGQRPSLTVGGRVFTDLSSLIVLYARVSTSTRFSTPRTANGTAGYAITSAKTWTTWAAQRGPDASTLGGVLTWAHGYGDTDVGQNSAAGPTNTVPMINDATDGHWQVAGGSGATAGQMVESFATPKFTIAAGKYPYVQCSGGQHAIWLYGYET